MPSVLFVWKRPRVLCPGVGWVARAAALTLNELLAAGPAADRPVALGSHRPPRPPMAGFLADRVGTRNFKTVFKPNTMMWVYNKLQTMPCLMTVKMAFFCCC